MPLAVDTLVCQREEANMTSPYVVAVNKTLTATSTIYPEINIDKYMTVNMERFAWLNIRGFNPIKFFTEIISRYIGHQCLLFIYN